MCNAGAIVKVLREMGVKMGTFRIIVLGDDSVVALKF